MISQAEQSRAEERRDLGRASKLWAGQKRGVVSEVQAGAERRLSRGESTAETRRGLKTGARVRSRQNCGKKRQGSGIREQATNRIQTCKQGWLEG